MRITEKVLVILFLIGFVMLQTKVPFGLVLTTLSSVLLALLYMLFGFALFNNIGFKEIFKRASYNGIRAGGLVVAVISGIFIGAGVLVVLFSVAHWPGANFLRLPYVVLTGIICVISAILTVMKKPIGNPVLIRALPVFLLIMYYFYKYDILA